jgi:hypothetical protein
VFPLEEHGAEGLQERPVLRRIGERRVAPQGLGLGRREMERLQQRDRAGNLAVKRLADRLDVGDPALEGANHQEEIVARNAHLSLRIIRAFPRLMGPNRPAPLKFPAPLFIFREPAGRC